jgi:hypothetical protein
VDGLFTPYRLMLLGKADIIKIEESIMDEKDKKGRCL